MTASVELKWSKVVIHATIRRVIYSRREAASYHHAYAVSNCHALHAFKNVR